MLLAIFSAMSGNKTGLPTLMLLIAPMTATGMVQKMQRNQMNAVLRMLSVFVVASDLTVFFQIWYFCQLRIATPADLWSNLQHCQGAVLVQQVSS